MERLGLGTSLGLWRRKVAVEEAVKELVVADGKYHPARFSSISAERSMEGAITTLFSISIFDCFYRLQFLIFSWKRAVCDIGALQTRGKSR